LVEPIEQVNVFTTYGQSNVSGRWTVSHFDGPVSPVPEAPVSVMFLAGMGVIAFIKSKKVTRLYKFRSRSFERLQIYFSQL
jgi:hypothetical protein